MDADEMRNIVEAVCDRITKHTLGMGKEEPSDTSHDILGTGDDWLVIREHGVHARSAIFAQGYKAFISVIDDGIEKPDDSKTFTVGKMSPYVPFPLEKMYEALNDAEGIEEGDTDRWGGGNIIGGSPRQEGSHLTVEEVIEIVHDVLRGDRP